MKMQLKKLRIGELAQELKIEKSVIRFWEKEFNIKSQRSPGGQRYFTLKDIKKFKTIKKLLYCQGLTIAGAKKILQQNLSKKLETSNFNSSILGASKTKLSKSNSVNEQILNLQQKLLKLQELL